MAGEAGGEGGRPPAGLRESGGRQSPMGGGLGRTGGGVRQPPPIKPWGVGQNRNFHNICVYYIYIYIHIHTYNA